MGISIGIRRLECRFQLTEPRFQTRDLGLFVSGKFRLRFGQLAVNLRILPPRFNGRNTPFRPAPALVLCHLLRQRVQFFTGKSFQHRRFGQKALVGKQVKFECAASRFVDLAPDERQLVVVSGRDFAFQHRLAQVLRRSRPAVRVFPHVTLTLMIVGGRQRLQLVEGDLVVGQCIEQHRRHRCQTQTALNVARAEPQQIADLCRSLPVRRQVAERRNLIGRVHLLALAVLHHRHHARHRPADDQHLDRVIVGHDAVRGGLVGVFLLFHQPAQRQRAPLTGGNTVPAIVHFEHDQIHQQTG